MSEYEYFDGPDAPRYEPETPEHRKKKYAYMEELIDRLDLDWIKQSFAGIMAKTGEDPNKMNFLSRERISINPELRTAGIFQPDENVIEINPLKINESVYHSQSSPSLFILRDIIHEEAHAVSKIRKKTTEEIHSGYSSRKKDGEKTVWLYSLFDEGVNEKLTGQIMDEYIKSHPDLASSQELQAYREIFRDDKANTAYVLPVSLVESMIAKISHETSITQQVVWEGILRGKMEGDDLAKEDLNKLFVEMFSQEFMDQLKNVHPSRQESLIADMIKSLDLSSIDPELWNRIQKRIKARAEYDNY